MENVFLLVLQHSCMEKVEAVKQFQVIYFSSNKIIMVDIRVLIGGRIVTSALFVLAGKFGGKAPAQARSA